MLKKYDRIIASEEFKIFLPFRNLLSKLCFLALLCKGTDSIEKTIKEKTEKISECN
jgi:hypothetical protein